METRKVFSVFTGVEDRHMCTSMWWGRRYCLTSFQKNTPRYRFIQGKYDKFIPKYHDVSQDKKKILLVPTDLLSVKS